VLGIEHDEVEARGLHDLDHLDGRDLQERSDRHVAVGLADEVFQPVHA
jgi:hypothetical protein